MADNANSNNASRDGANGEGRRNFNKRGKSRGRGGRGGRGGGRGHSNKGDDRSWKRDNKRREQEGDGGETSQDFVDKRERWGIDRSAKRQRVMEDGDGQSYMSIAFSAEEIAAEERRPKRKVAVLIGYAGTGYHGLQINHHEKSIEGELFAAFVGAGAIGKTNADDPKKSSMVRCARTDKGVHAAGNVLSLKLIIEDEDIVERINERLPEQIRVWGIQRTNNAFSAYRACESRWYEYLMPSYALLPPQPHSFLGKKISETAKEKGVHGEYIERLDDVADYWDEVEKNDILPILEALEPQLRTEVMKVLKDSADQELGEDGMPVPVEGDKPEQAPEEETHEATGTISGGTKDPDHGELSGDILGAGQATLDNEKSTSSQTPTTDTRPAESGEGIPEATADQDAKPQPELSPVEAAVRRVKNAYIAAKRRYRVSEPRLKRLQTALDQYLGTQNYHNYTVNKGFKDPSAKRNIKSFVVNPKPIPIRDTEWLSLKVHGQSFMMHQIRKMVAMAVLATRCGAPVDLIGESYGPRRISIPKMPGLGLMLERPMFTEYSRRAKAEFGREPIDFDQYDDAIQAFKDREIYSRMFDVEERENAFHKFFHQLDNFRTNFFLWVTAGGFEAAYERSGRVGEEKIPKALEAQLGDDADGVREEE